MLKTTLFTLFVLLICSKLFSQDTIYGQASFYADKFNGRLTANGEVFDNQLLTAAHKQLAFNTVVKVTNLKNQKSVIVRINDRGPFVGDRVIDLSRAAANQIGMVNDGIADVRIEILKELTEIKQNPPLTTNNLFEVNVQKIKQGRYAVQVASYQYVENMLNEIERLKEVYGDKTLVHVSKVDSIRVYRVIVGPYDDKDKADKKLQKFKESGNDGLVIDLSNLE